jgi:YD repeat-containing protein
VKITNPMRALMLAVLMAATAAAQSQTAQNEDCWPWRTTVSAIGFGAEPIYGNSAEEVCRALIDRSNPQIVNGGTVRVTKTFTGLVDSGGNGNGWYCGFNGVGVRVDNGESVPSESGPRAIDGVVREGCEPTASNACGVSNPTDPALGIKTEIQTDYAGAGAHPLSLVRSYRSQAMTPRNLDDTDRWRHNYAMALEIRRQPYGDTMGLVARRADGKGLLFSQIAPATWRATSTTKDLLTEQRDANNVLLGFTYMVFDDDSVETYDATGRLQSIKARNGWLTTLTYSDAATPTTVAPIAGLLIAVRNHFGRELKFVYDAAGRMAQALPPGAVADSGAGSASSPIRYAYEETASLAVGVAAQRQLTSVTWQDGTVRRYHYENTRWPQALTGITDEAGVRWATYSYDYQGRVTRSEHVGGADRADFSYDQAPSNRRRTTVTTYASGSASSAAYEFTDQNSMRQTYSVSAPCALCGTTQQQSTYNTVGDPTKQIAHDGTVTFYKYDAKGRETERATFAASYGSATTRPALANATKVVSTKWHAPYNLPTQVAEPNKTTANTYNSKGMLTGTSWTATTDATGAAKFTAVKSGSTYATGWSYSASNLATTIVAKETAAGATTAVETGRWTAAYAAIGDLTRVTNVTDSNRFGRATAYDAHGRLSNGTTSSGTTVSMRFDGRGRLAEYKNDNLSMRFQWTAFGELQRIDGPGTDVVVYEYDTAQRLTGVRKQLTYAAYDDSTLTRFAQSLRKFLELPISLAHAQVTLPPLTPIPNPFTPSPRGLLPLPLDPSDTLMPSLSPPDPNRELARRLGESLNTLIDRLFCSPECKKLQAEIQTTLNEVRWRYFSMMVDKNNLFCTRLEGRGSWRGHQQQYVNKQSKLQTHIDRAKAINCPYNPEADDWVSRPPPICPG